MRTKIIGNYRIFTGDDNEIICVDGGCPYTVGLECSYGGQTCTIEEIILEDNEIYIKVQELAEFIPIKNLRKAPVRFTTSERAKCRPYACVTA